MEFNPSAFIKQLYTQEFFPGRFVAGKKVLIIRDLQANGTAIQYLQDELKKMAAAECLTVPLFSELTMASYLSIADALTNIGR